MDEGTKKRNGGQFEDRLSLLLKASSSLDLTSGDRQDGNERAAKPDVAPGVGAFADYLESCNRITQLRQQFYKLFMDLHRNQSLQAAHGMMDADVLEGRIVALQKLDSHLQTIVANKDYMLEQIHASPSNLRLNSVLVDVSHHDDVLKALSELSAWIKNLEMNLGYAELEQGSCVMEDNLRSITGSIETLVANLNKDLKQIQLQQDTLRQICNDQREL